jgi:hypothetical protein
VVDLAFWHTGLVLENVGLLFSTVASQRRTLLQDSVPLQTSIADLVHALQLGVVVHWSLRRAGVAFLLSFVPHWSLLRADLTFKSGLVPNRFDIVALLSRYLLALFGHIVELCPVGADNLTFQCCIVPGSALSTSWDGTLLGVRVKRLAWGTIRDTFHWGFVPGWISRTGLTFEGCPVVERSSGGANLTRLGLRVPDRLGKRTDAVSRMNRLRVTLFAGGVVNLSGFARRITDIGGYIVNEAVGATFTGFFSKTEVEAVWALETVAGDWAHVRLIDGATGLVILNTVREDLVFVLVFCYIAVHPVFCIQIVLILALTQIHQSRRGLGFQRGWGVGAVRSADLVSDTDIVLLLEDIVIEVSWDGALSAGCQLLLQSLNRSVHFFRFFKEGVSSFCGLGWRVARFWGQRNFDIVLNFIESISFAVEERL